MLQKDFELEIFALVTGCFSVLAVVILAIVVIHLYSSIKK
jgi:high-affinity Fe2+/Pb2+ permease